MTGYFILNSKPEILISFWEESLSTKWLFSQLNGQVGEGLTDKNPSSR